MNKKALICHYRVGRTDGVSLEIDKRADVLKEMGWRVFLLAGPGSDGADFIIPELDFDREEVRKIARNSFGFLSEYPDESSLMDDIQKLASKIYSQVRKVTDRIHPDIILVHNIFSHGRHIASALAFYTLLKETGIPALATHHDFYWERDDFKTPSCRAIDDFLKKYVPPKLPGLKHAVISSRAANVLKGKANIEAKIIPDTLNFSMPPWQKDEFNHDFLDSFSLSENDILILQATRIVKRKGIELMLPIVKQLNTKKYLDQLIGKTLYNGKKITKDSGFVYILSGYAEQEAEKYLDSIISYLSVNHIPHASLQPRIAAGRGSGKSGKTYSLFDTYVYADVVSYPSIFEGWGNQFIEAVFAKKPVIAFEYPVFKTDIKPKGYEVISLGSEISGDSETGFYRLPEKTIDDVCNNIIQMLISPETVAKLEKNFNIGRMYNSRETLKRLMKEIMEQNWV